MSIALDIFASVVHFVCAKPMARIIWQLLDAVCETFFFFFLFRLFSWAFFFSVVFILSKCGTFQTNNGVFQLFIHSLLFFFSYVFRSCLNKVPLNERFFFLTDEK